MQNSEARAETQFRRGKNKHLPSSKSAVVILSRENTHFICIDQLKQQSQKICPSDGKVLLVATHRQQLGVAETALGGPGPYNAEKP